jgi:teichoic acid transport system permease protein
VQPQDAVMEDVPPAPGLQRAGARVPIDEYSRRLWERRWFVAAYSSASNGVGYERSYLGQAWQLLTPLLTIIVYYLIFGLLLHTSRGIPNFIAFLSVGVFGFSYITQSLISGAKSITNNLGLVRALQFPRAVLPLSTTLVALQQLIYSLFVLVPILLFTGERPSLRWLELIPALGLETLFCLGLAFAAARIGAQVPDTTQVLPFVTRIWMYVSGVMYSVTVFAQHHHGLVITILTHNPAYIYLALARHALLTGNPASLNEWLMATVWSVGLFSVSYLYFWRGEETYGNV